jgi:hypothetical protein
VGPRVAVSEVTKVLKVVGVAGVFVGVPVKIVIDAVVDILGQVDAETYMLSGDM